MKTRRRAAPGAGSGTAPEPAGLRTGDHACLIYRDPVEQVGLVAALLRAGLARGERCFYLAERPLLDRVAAALAATGIEVERECERGMLVLTSFEDLRAGGPESDPGGLLDALRALLERGGSDGASGLRVATDLSWVLAGRVEPEQVARYERAIDTLCATGQPALVLCQYDRRRLPPRVVRGALGTHPVVVHGGQALRNPFYEPPDLTGGGVSEVDRLDWMLAQLERSRLAEDERSQLVRARAARSEAEAARTAAEEAHQHLRDLFLQAPVLLAVLRGPEHIFDLVNPAYVRATGRRSAADLLGKPARVALPDQLGQGYLDLLDQAYATGEPFVGTELPVQLDRLGDGHLDEAYFTFVYQPTRDPDGTVSRIFFVGIEMTEQVRTRQRIEDLVGQLAAERARLEVVLQELPAGVLIAEAPSGRIVLSNEQMRRIWGPAVPLAAELADYEQFRGFHADGRPYRPEEWPLARATRLGELVHGEEIEIERSDGSRGVVRISAAPIRDSEGRIVAGVATFFDVTEQKRADQERVELLRREQQARTRAEAAQERLAFLAEASRILAVSLDYETTMQTVARLAVSHLADYCVIDVLESDGTLSRVATAHADPAKDELVRLLRHYPPDPHGTHPIIEGLRSGQPRLMAEFPASLTGAIAYTAEYAEILERLAPRSAMYVPLIARGRTLGMLSLLAAESGRRYTLEDLALAEELARRAALAVDNARLYQQAQEAIRAREEFLAIASHELRNPVASLKGMAQQLRRSQERDQLDDERLLRYLMSMEQMSDRLAALTQDLLDVSRLQRGKLPLRRKKTSLVVLVREAVERARARSDEHRFEATFDGDPFLVDVDPDRIEQIVSNLLDNAVRYSPGGGEIRVSLTREGEGALLRVQDRGIGLPPGFAERIFEPFGRAPNAAARNIPGLGLGLYICRQIAERHGGRLRAESAGEGQGTTMLLWLPVLAAQGSTPSERSAPGYAAGQEA